MKLTPLFPAGWLTLFEVAASMQLRRRRARFMGSGSNGRELGRLVMVPGCCSLVSRSRLFSVVCRSFPLWTIGDDCLFGER